MKGTLREGSFTGDPERYVKEGLEMGVCFHRGPAVGGTWSGASFLGPSYQRNFYEASERDANAL